MKITHLKTNHIENPLGFALEKPVFSWIVEDTVDKHQTAAQVMVALDDKFEHLLFTSGKLNGSEIDSLAYRPNIILKPRTRYFWKVKVWGETESAESETAWFETAKMTEAWQAQWITPDFEDPEKHPILFKTFSLPSPVSSARAYVCGLGLYHFELNGKKVGDEYLTPNCNVYDQWLQYQTYDLTDQLNAGENRIDIFLGNGWYKGRYCGDGGGHSKIYGDRFALICELHIRLVNGEEIVVVSDPAWSAKPAPILSSEIYDGEIYDARFQGNSCGVKEIDLDINKLKSRRSLPICVLEERKPVAILHTPAGETVLDMGQNMVGWVRFRTQAPAGTQIHLQYGEVLQGGNFYRENLRSAKAEYIYYSDGQEAIVEPRFTFYGFRYVKVSGWVGELNPDDFTGCVVYSKMDIIGNIETSNEKVNQLFKNCTVGAER